MKAAIGERLRVLGAQVAPVTGAGFAEQWRRILFRHPLYRKDWDAYGIDRYIIQITGICTIQTACFFCDNWLHRITPIMNCPTDEAFTTTGCSSFFKAGSKDYGELDGLVEEQ